jgi:hypothetical protein
MVFIGVAILFFCLIVGMPVFFAFLASAMWFIFIGDVSPTL